MPDINIKVRNKVAKGEYAVIVCDNSDYVAHFDFDAEWDEYDTKTARFVYGGKYTDVVFSGNECAVPVMQDTRAVTVGVFAGDLHTTTPAYFACVPSILCGGGVPADPTPEVYAQLMEMLNKESGVWYPAVDDAGNMSWTRSISETAPQPVNIKGPKGDVGAQGETGPQGPKGDTGATGPQGPKGDTGANGKDGMDGKDGADGQDGSPGADGKDGVDGKSAYELAQDNGFQGTMQEWLASLVGSDGTNGVDGNDGVSPAVSVAAITGGNRVTITDAEGAKTFDVMDGAQGASGADGKDYVLTDADKQEIAEAAAGFVDVPSVQHDWNQNDSTAADYIKNRPCYEQNEEHVITWDGDTTGKVSCCDGYFYKVSDLTPEKSDLIGATITVSNGNTVTLPEGYFSDLKGFGYATEFFFVAYTAGECEAFKNPTTIPEPGIYFVYTSGVHLASLSWSKNTLKQLDAKFIPDMDSVILNSSTADSTKKFKITVDDSGAITATEVT